MEKLNPGIKDLVTRFTQKSFFLSREEEEQIRLERERINTLNVKLYNRTKMMKEASIKEHKQYEKNKQLIRKLKDIEVEAGANH